MTEFSVPADFTIPDDANLTDAVLGNADEHPDEVVFDRKVNGSWQPVTAKQFAAEVKALAAGLIAAGIQAGDRVCIMSGTRYEWTLADYAIWTAGAVTVPIYETSSTEQVEWIVSDSGAVGIFLETATHRESFDEVRATLTGDIARLGHRRPAASTTLTEPARASPRTTSSSAVATLRADSLATIIYTSGTTGRPKGCELTHGNFAVRRDVDRRRPRGDVRLETSRPCCSCRWRTSFARIIQVGCVQTRVRLGHTADIKNLMPDLAAFQPTFMLVGAAGVREGLQHREAAGPRRRARARSSTSPSGSRSTTASPSTAAAYDAVAAGSCRTASSTRSSTPSCGPRSAARRTARSPAVPRSAPGSATSSAASASPIYEGYGLTETTAGRRRSTGRAR